MKYERMVKGRFLERPNRFIAYVEIAGKKETVHVKNTGRCKELLVPGATVYLQKSDNPERKTQWDLISVEKGRRMINMDCREMDTERTSVSGCDTDSTGDYLWKVQI